MQLPFGLDNLGDGQRKALLVGVPAVAALAIGVRLTNKNKPAPVDPKATTPATPASTAIGAGIIPPASTDVLGVGQLMDFESQLTSAIGRLGDQISAQQPADTPAAAVPYFPQHFPPPAGNCPQGLVRIVSSGQINGQGQPAGYWSCATPAQANDLWTFLRSLG